MTRALAVGIEIHEPYEMQYDWLTLENEQILGFARLVTATMLPGWVAVRIAGEALSAGSISVPVARAAFEQLANAHESAREAFSRWRQWVSQ
jgi:hypothetical protein